MNPVRIDITHVAQRHIRAIDAWWRQHRPDAPRKFADELSAAFARLTRAPYLGSTYGRYRRGAEVRRVLLRETSHFVYYRYDADRILIADVRHAARGSGPQLM